VASSIGARRTAQPEKGFFNYVGTKIAVMLIDGAVLPLLVWSAIAAYLSIAGFIIFATDFRAPEENFGAQFVICLVALIFAAAWPFRAMRRVLQRAG
jgi:hypothetical protein